MSERNRYIILIGLLIGCISSVYFFSLLLPVPFFITATVTALAAVLLFMWVVPERTAPGNIPVVNNRKEWIGLLLLAYGILWISFTAPDKANTYGEWDALAIWNLHARYLVDPLHWQKLFAGEYGHPDYPLSLPATLAFFLRLTSSPDNLIIPFVFHMLITLCIPVLIYGELWRKNVVVAVVVLTIFPIEAFYIQQSMNQCADVLLSFFFLCALICMRYSEENKKYLILSVLFMGCCAWTKNEGIILAVVLFAINVRKFLSKKTMKYTLLAMVVPVVAIVTFKVICPVTNDLIAESGPSALGLLLKPERYATIFNYLIETANTEFPYTRLLIGVYLIICLVRKQRPGREFWLVTACMVVYMMIYIVTPKDLKWHLHTSADRLLLQLFPALLYAMGSGIADMKWGFSGVMQQKATENKPVTVATPKTKARVAAPNKGKRQ